MQQDSEFAGNSDDSALFGMAGNSLTSVALHHTLHC